MIIKKVSLLSDKAFHLIVWFKQAPPAKFTLAIKKRKYKDTFSFRTPHSKEQIDETLYVFFICFNAMDF
jgi:hypothetical protein